ncbi:hypothetical protein TWF718_003759 [Orbilia javanica]|uniref:Uncharacterized protein n=1 Tax=Orbilia javanica TaxID=47235 RepID=A0AAN8MTV6_9PEZI
MASTSIASSVHDPSPDLEMATNITTSSRPASAENATSPSGSAAERLNCKIYGLSVEEFSNISETDPQKQAMQTYTNYLNQKLAELPEKFLNDIWSILGIPKSEKFDEIRATEQRMDVLASIADVIRSRREEDAGSTWDRGATAMSIDRIAKLLCESYRVRTPEVGSTEWNSLRQLIFAMIGLLCMLFQASIPGDKQTTETTVFSIVTPGDSLVPITSQGIDMARRGIRALLLGFGELCPAPSRREGLDNYSPEDILHTSKLCFSSLSRVANIHIEWVDNLGSHLYFDSDSASLKLFRLPSFCFANLAFYSKRPLYN